jgi:hypothetical protein
MATFASMASDVPTPGMPDTITELVTDTLWLRWKGRQLVAHEWGAENRYRDVRTLFVWAKNPGQIADSADALPAQTMLNEHIYIGQEIKRNHGFPETLYSGFEPPYRLENGRKVLDRGPNTAYVSADPQGKIQKAVPDTSVGDIGLELSTIDQMLNDAMSIPAPDRGEGSSLGQARSAPAISRMQMRGERRRQRKILFAKKWEQDVFCSVMGMTGYHALGMTTREQVRSILPVRLDVTFPDDAFVLDPYMAAQKDQIETQAGLETVEENVRKRHPEASEEQIASMVLEAEKQRESGQGGVDRQPDPSPRERSQAQS